MIPHAENRDPLISLGVGETHSFQIKASVKAFEMMTGSNLYKDVAEAVIRELYSNLSDSMRMAGRGHIPCEVHLPNSLEPYLEFKDTGVGISHTAIGTVFTVLFESTKEESNETLGCKGLGCKSPFGISESFTVTSIFDGVKRVYTMFKNEHGGPEYTLNSEVATIEHTGVTIRIPIERHMFADLQEKASKVFAYFNPKPIVTGASDFKFKELKYSSTVKGTDWWMREGEDTSNRYSYRRTVINAIQGSVVYPIDDGSISPMYPELKLWGMPLDIEFPIGALDVAMSREELSYDQATIKAIGDKLQEIELNIGALLEKEVALADTLWEATKTCKEYTKIISKAFDFKPTWKGKELTQAVEVPYEFVYLYKYNENKGKRLNTSTKVDKSSSTYIPLYKYISLNPANEYKIIKRDKNDRPVQRIKEYFNTLLSDPPRIVLVTTDDTLQEIKEKFGGYLEPCNISDLPLPASVTTSSGKAAVGSRHGMYSIEKDRGYNAWRNSYVCAELLSCEAAEDLVQSTSTMKLYFKYDGPVIRLNNGRIIYKDSLHIFRQQVTNFLDQEGKLLDYKIVLLRPSSIKKYAKKSDWLAGDDYINKSQRISTFYTWSSDLRVSVDNFFDLFDRMSTEVKRLKTRVLDKDSTLNELRILRDNSLKSIATLHKKDGSSRYDNHFISWFIEDNKHIKEIPLDEVNLNVLVDKVLNHYPLLGEVQVTASSDISVLCESVVAYIESLILTKGVC
jgi:hypothetical protein